MNVLIVDDSEVARRLIARTLQLAMLDLGVVHMADNGLQALRTLRTVPVDLVLADLNMPIMDGSTLIAQMDADPGLSPIPVLVVSGEPTAIEPTPASPAVSGPRGSIDKPFTPEMLAVAINNLGTPSAPSAGGPSTASALQRVLTSVGLPSPVATTVLDAPVVTDPLLCARVTFRGTHQGSLTLLCEESLAMRLLRAWLPDLDRDEFTAHRGADALGELANLACGLAIRDLDAAGVTHLDPPEVWRTTREHWDLSTLHSSTDLLLVAQRPIAVSFRAHPVGSAPIACA